MNRGDDDPLSRYVQRKVKEQHLSRRDVSVRSGGEIGESYVGAIMNGTCANVTIDKLRALARGIGADEMELARIALGSAVAPAIAAVTDDEHSLILVDIRKKVIISSDVAEIARHLVQLSPRERNSVLRFVRKLVKAKVQQPRHRIRKQS